MQRLPSPSGWSGGGITSTDLLTTNLLITKCGIASVQGYNSNLTLSGNYLNFYYDAVNSKLELWLVSGIPLLVIIILVIKD